MESGQAERLYDLALQKAPEACRVVSVDANILVHEVVLARHGCPSCDSLDSFRDDHVNIQYAMFQYASWSFILQGLSEGT
jgi:hypothetical protein